MSKTMYHSRKYVCVMSLVLTLGLAAGTAGAGITTGLIGYYPLDEGAGNVARDMSGAGHNGTLYNGATWISPGHQGSGVNFNGTTDTRIDLGTWNPAEGTGQLSLALWMRWAGGGGTYQGLIGKRNTWPDTTMFQFQVRPENGGTFRIETGSAAIISPDNTLDSLAQTWMHVAATFDGTTARLYLNGQQVAVGAFALNTAGAASNMGIGSVTGGGAGFSGNTEVFSGAIDEVFIYNRALSEEELALIMSGNLGDRASNPNPVDGADDVPQDVTLAWDPVETAATRDVYFGTSYEDVNDASPANPGEILVSMDQTATTFEPAGLDYGRTYYWRVDEVNATPDTTVFTGRVWSFTTELYSYPIENVTANASSEQTGSRAARTVDRSGLNANDQHSDDMKQMWMSTGVPAWIEYTFDKEYKLDKLWVWNANSQLEGYMAFGAKDVTIEYSTDGQTWTQLEDVPEFAQGPGVATYTADTVVDFGGVIAKYVRLTINSTWGSVMSASLSEVRFFHAPVLAREPQPADGATNVSLNADLSWRSGRDALSHDVYLDEDTEAVAAGAVAPVTQTQRIYTPESLNYGTAYYWKVDEVGETQVYEGDVWSFTTSEYATVEDFEDYDDDIDGGTTIFQTWIDGVTNGTGSYVGYEEAAGGTFGERTIVRSGSQSMPLQYDNASSPLYSETARQFATAQDWAQHGADTLVLRVRGRASGFKETPSGQIIMNGTGVDIWDTADQFRYVYKDLSGNGSMVVRIDSMLRTDGWAKAGVMIRESLHPGSKHTFVCLTPDYGASFQQRPETGNVMSQVSTNTVVSSCWVKLTRTGDAFTAQQSADGVAWSDIVFTSPVNVSMAKDVLIGLAVTSHNAGAVIGAEFSNLATTGTVTGSWQIASIGVEQPEGNSLEPLYVRIEDAAGAGATVVNPDSAITLRSAWQEWRIPYGDLAGVNLSRVKTMRIGVGSRSAPTAGGTGIVYIDDIAVGHPLAQ